MRLVPLIKKVEEAKKNAEEVARYVDENLPKILEEDNRKRREAFAERARRDEVERKALQEQIDRLKRK